FAGFAPSFTQSCLPGRSEYSAYAGRHLWRGRAGAGTGAGRTDGGAGAANGIPGYRGVKCSDFLRAPATEKREGMAAYVMDVTLTQAHGILTPQRNGFLASGPYPFTHALSAYTGCAFGNTTCGMYCYAQFLPNWAARKPA